MPNVYEVITDYVIKKIESSEKMPWQKPWNNIGYEATMPCNLVTKKPYNGINHFITSLASDCPYFLTYNQAQKFGGQVKKGSKGIPVIFWNFLNSKTETLKNGDPKKIPMIKYYTVFSALDVEGVEIPRIASPIVIEEWQKHEKAELIAGDYLARENVTLESCESNRAYYHPAKDLVRMPLSMQFKSQADYYATLFHELGHSTGHDKRLARGIANDFGSHDYSKEELVAEFTSAFLMAETGLSTEPQNSIAYMQSWLKALKENPKWLVEAAGKAQKAANLILNVNQVTETQESEAA